MRHRGGGTNETDEKFYSKQRTLDNERPNLGHLKMVCDLCDSAVELTRIFATIRVKKKGI